MLAAIAAVGFEGRVLDKAPEPKDATVAQLVVSELPEPLRAIFEQAAIDGKLVLVDIHGPG